MDKQNHLRTPLVSIGPSPWDRQAFIVALETFADLYKQRPISKNQGGMRAPHLFLLWFALRALRPKAVIESGVWMGQGTWFIEHACPDAELHCIEPNQARIRYRSAHATYHEVDFAAIDWSSMPQAESVVFFDDHQNAYERLRTAQWFGFKHLLFEDNYPTTQGDCYSLKKVLAQAGFTPPLHGITGLRMRLLRLVRRLLKLPSPQPDVIPPNDYDACFVRQNVSIYCELPPVFKPPLTMWGDAWDDPSYPTPPPLLTAPTAPYHQAFFEEAIYYNWMCYVRLKDRR